MARKKSTASKRVPAKPPQATERTELEQFFTEKQTDIWNVCRAMFLCQEQALNDNHEELYCTIRIAREKLESVHLAMDTEEIMARVREVGAK